MRSRLVFLTIVLVSSFAFCAVAQDNAVPLKHNGANGTWFPAAMVDLIQGESLELDSLRAKVPKLEIKLDLRLKRINDLRLAIDAANEALEVSKDATVTAEKAMTAAAEREVAAEERARSAEDQASKWYRHPATWTGVGVVLTVVVELIIWGVVK